jgi:hypothetical protein
MRALLLLPLLAGCSPSVEGWWNLARISAARDGQTDAREDAGFALFDEFGAIDLGLSYTFEPVTGTWTPNPHPEVISYPTEWEDTPEGEPDFAMYFPVGADVFFVEFDVLDLRPASMVLESVSSGDGSVFRFELAR